MLDGTITVVVTQRSEKLHARQHRGEVRFLFRLWYSWADMGA